MRNMSAFRGHNYNLTLAEGRLDSAITDAAQRPAVTPFGDEQLSASSVGRLACLDRMWISLHNATSGSVAPLPEEATGICDKDGAAEMGLNWHMLLLLTVVVAGVTGNVLVCIAVSVERKLQNITNYFLVSLAVADLLVSLIVMPCSIVQEFMGYWPFGLVICDLWQVLDVTMCTSSIMHMCAISIDRYVGIRDPLKTRGKTVRVAVYKMAAVWCISFVTASPIILLSVLEPEAVLAVDDQQRYQCAISNRYFLSYGSLTAFFIPLFIMLFAYSLTIHLLKRQAAHRGIRRSQNRSAKQRKSIKDSTKVHLCEQLSGARSSSNGGSVSCKDDDWQHRVIDKSLIPRSARRDTSGATRRISENSVESPSGECDSTCGNYIRVDTCVDMSCQTSPYRSGLNIDIVPHRATETTPSSPENKSVVSPHILDSATSQTTTSQRSHDDRARLASPSGVIRGKVKLRDVVRKHSAAITAAGIMMQRHEICRRRESSVRTERKAVKVLGMMFAIFVFCWSPFFSLNFTMGVCDTCHIDTIIFKVCLWLGYVSSTLNPIIYTVFNRTFKVTFLKLATCRYQYIFDNRRTKITSFGWNGRTTPLRPDRGVSDSLIETHV